MSPLPILIHTHTLTRRSIGTSLSQGLITIVIVLFLATLLFVFLRRNALKRAEERNVLKLTHLRGTNSSANVGTEGQARGSEDTLVEQGGGGQSAEVRMELGMLPTGAMGLRPMATHASEAPPPAYEARMDGTGAGRVMEAAYLPDRR